MENKNSCKENFEMAKTELQDMEAIADFFSNPMIKSGMEMLGEIPGIGSLAKNLLEQEVAGFQKRKREEFLSYITESGELIAKSDVADVPFLMELARTLEVLNRLATNEKVLYIANLFKHTFLLAGDRDIDLYEENLKRLEELASLTEEETERMRRSAWEHWKHCCCSSALLPALFPEAAKKGGKGQ